MQPIVIMSIAFVAIGLLFWRYGVTHPERRTAARLIGVASFVSVAVVWFVFTQFVVYW